MTTRAGASRVEAQGRRGRPRAAAARSMVATNPRMGMPTDLGAGQPGAAEGGPDAGGVAGADLVGQPGAGVGLVDEDRQPALLRRQVHRGAHVAADPEHRLGARLVKDRAGRP